MLSLLCLAFVQAACSQTWCPLDPTFNPRLNAQSAVYYVTVQANGKILIGGAFLSINGTAITNVARLNQDGSLDLTFNPGSAANLGSVDAIAVQNDGKIIIGGSFVSSAGGPQNLARLNANGSVDPTFDPDFFADGPVNAVVVQSDGKILFGGDFNLVDNIPRVTLARVYPNGSLDMTFDACIAASAGNGATGLSVLSNQKILATGNFTFTTNSAVRNGIARLNPCGDVDLTYAPQPGINSGAAAYVFALRSNGQVILGGDFTTYGQDRRSGITQLDTSGTVDNSFDPGTGIDEGRTVYAMALQSDGKVIIGGNFGSYNEQPQAGLARLNLDGSLDMNCDPGLGPDNSISSLAIQADGRILVAGRFTSFDGQPRSGLARLGGARLGPLSQLENGQFQMLFYGNEQSRYSLQASSDLKNWSDILTNVFGASSPIPLVDPAMEPLPQRFYRTKLTP